MPGMSPDPHQRQQGQFGGVPVGLGGAGDAGKLGGVGAGQ